MTSRCVPARGARLEFDGWIAGLGTASGTRIVLGHWPRSPFGAVSDVMVESTQGHRRVLVPSEEVAEFVAATYMFDEVVVVPVEVWRGSEQWRAVAGPLALSFRLGPRRALGRVLRVVPPALARRPAWVAAVDLPARVMLPGVRTRGSAGGGRREWYGAQDLVPIVSATGTWDGRDLGGLAPVAPPVRFGFGSVPKRPALVRVMTTVEVSAARS